MFRSRDMVALMALLILSRMAYDNSTESLRASVHLAFYLENRPGSVVSPLDVDGDGTNEALAVLQQPQEGTAYEFRLLDLKALHHHKRYSSGIGVGPPPFEPPVLFSTKVLEQTSSQGLASPVEMTSGQVLLQKPQGNHEGTHKTSKAYLSQFHGVQLDDRNRHYFCGTDWHEASQKCGQPCPDGQATHCPGDERCYADTPCDIHQKAAASLEENHQILFELTPGGGLPSLITLWSNGVLSLHSLTRDKPTQEGPPKKQRAKPLELKELWQKQILPKSTSHQAFQWEESNLLFLDAYDSMEASGADHGMILVSGSYLEQIRYEDEDDPLWSEPSSFLLAVDAIHGTILWDSFSAEEKEASPLPLPIVKGTSSQARRRSKIAALEDSGPTALKENLPNCDFTFKRHLREVLPYAYWTKEDSHLAAVHLEQTKKRHSSKGKDSAASSSSSSHTGVSGKDAPKAPAGPPGKNGPKKWHHRFHKPNHALAVRGRPNVLVTQIKGGMQIRSLRNGRPLCHMSFLEETLYSDLNNDGVLDQVQLVLPRSQNTMEIPKELSEVFQDIADRIKADSGIENDAKARTRDTSGSTKNDCYAKAMSGVPSRERLFYTHLCGNAHDGSVSQPTVGLSSIAPVVVESLTGRRDSRDLVVALSNGMVHRLQGRSGKREWSLVGQHQRDFPTWTRERSGTALLARLQSSNVPPPIRPVLLAGENSMAVLSVRDGSVLASTTFPQASLARPILADVSNDGTTDLVVLSEQGIWGYRIQVESGSPTGLRILVGLLFFGLMLAFVRNRTQGKDVRATDL